MDINKALNDFINNTDRTLLIDGKWGSGKTYCIKEFIKGNKDKKICYISLFGKETIEDINTEIYNKNHRGRKVLNTTITHVTSVISKVKNVYTDGANYLLKGLNYLLDNSDNIVSGDFILIFDDLERISEKLSLSSVMGYIFELLVSQIKIICLCDSSEISNALDKRSFTKFKEKVFDRYVVLNPCYEDIFKEFIKKYNINIDIDLLEIFNGNIRNAKRVCKLFEDILTKMDTKKIDLNKNIDNNVLIIACTNVIKICLFENNGNENNDSNFILNLKKYDKNIQAGFNEVKKTLNKDINSREGIALELIIPIIDYYLRYEEEGLISSLSQTEELEEKTFLDERIYYLSDSEKIDFYNKYKELLEGKTYIDEKMIKTFQSIIRYYDDVEESFIDLYIDNLCNSVQINTNSDIYDIVKDYKYLNDDSMDSYVGQRIDQICTKLKNKLNEKFKNHLINEVVTRFENKEYNVSLHYLKLLFKTDMDVEEIKKFVIEKDYLMPDLLTTIDSEVWSFAHSVCKLYKTVDLKDEFFNYAITLCKKNKTNKSLIDRYYALLHYNFDFEMSKEQFKNLILDI